MNRFLFLLFVVPLMHCARVVPPMGGSDVGQPPKVVQELMSRKNDWEIIQNQVPTKERWWVADEMNEVVNKGWIQYTPKPK